MLDRGYQKVYIKPKLISQNWSYNLECRRLYVWPYFNLITLCIIKSCSGFWNHHQVYVYLCVKIGRKHLRACLEHEVCFGAHLCKGQPCFHIDEVFQPVLLPHETLSLSSRVCTVTRMQQNFVALQTNQHEDGVSSFGND